MTEFQDEVRQTRTEAEIRAALAELQERRARMREELGDLEGVFRERVRRLVETIEDRAAADDMWDYLEGKIDQRELRRRPAFAVVWAAEREALVGRLVGSGVFDLVRAYMEQKDAADADADPEVSASWRDAAGPGLR